MKWLTTFFIILISVNVYADQLVIEPDMGREPILQVMKNSKKSIKLVMYGFTDQKLMNAIKEQQQAGKSIAVILEQSPYKAKGQNKKSIQLFKKNSISWRHTAKHFNYTHQKTMITDDQQAMVMTFNFTHSAFDKQRNFALIIDNPKDVKEIVNQFNQDWSQQQTNKQSSRLIWSPDNSRDTFNQLIDSSRQSIKIYTQGVQDKQIIKKLTQVMQRGVKVEMLTSKKLNNKQLQQLQAAGAHIKRSKKLYIHAKVFIIDNQRALLGSTNLTSNSLDRNRELSVVTTDPGVIQQLNATFDRDWKISIH